MKSRTFLKKCELTSRAVSEAAIAGLTKQHPAFEIGEFKRVARGFADLGYEEFFLLDRQKLVSLHTGSISSLNTADEKFFFVVPESDLLIDWIVSNGFEIVSAKFVEQREWSVKVCKSIYECSAGILEFEASSRSFEECLLDLILKTLDSAAGDELPRLRTEQ